MDNCKAVFSFCERRNQHGGRKFKLNFKLIYGKEICTIVNDHKHRIGELKEVTYERNSDGYSYRFAIKNGYTLVILNEIFFYHTLLRTNEEGIIFEFSPDPVLSGMIAYCLFETYGFPLEFAVDEMERYGIPVDEHGFYILEDLSRKRNKNTYKDKDAFG